jgi:hypothetical protein
MNGVSYLNVLGSPHHHIDLLYLNVHHIDLLYLNVPIT